MRRSSQCAQQIHLSVMTNFPDLVARPQKMKIARYCGATQMHTTTVLVERLAGLLRRMSSHLIGTACVQLKFSTERAIRVTFSVCRQVLNNVCKHK